MDGATDELIPRPSDDPRSCRYCLTYVPIAPLGLSHEVQILHEDWPARPVCSECWRRSNAKILGKPQPPPETEEERRARERRVIEAEIEKLQARLEKIG
jgi:hypothetical protein